MKHGITLAFLGMRFLMFEFSELPLITNDLGCYAETIQTGRT